MKGHNQSNGRGRYYGLILVLAFGAAMFGVMVLHKLREKRIFNLLLKQKDSQLLSLQLLLRNERDYTKESRRKTEEMKTKIYSLLNQRKELDSKILQMQSKISSLKEEQRTMELALEENQNEINLMRERERELNKDSPKIKALSEILRQKEAEIEDLKNRLDSDLPVNVWSVSTDDPSNPLVNLTTKVSIETEVGGSKEKRGGLADPNNYRNDKNSVRDADGSRNEFASNKDGENSTLGEKEDRRENRVGITDTGEITGEEQSHKLEISQGVIGRGSTAGEKSGDQGQGKNIEDSQDGGGFGIGNEVNNRNATRTIVNFGVEVHKLRDEDRNSKMLGGTRDGWLGKQESSQEGANQELGVNFKGGMKLEMPYNSQNGATYGSRGNHVDIRKAKGKRWRTIAKNRVSENNGNSEDNEVAHTSGRRFFEDTLESERKRRLGHGNLRQLIRQHYQNMGLIIRNESGKEDGKFNISNKLQHMEDLRSKSNYQVGFEHIKERATQKAVLSTDVKLLKPENSKDAENTNSKDGNTDIDQPVEKGKEMDFKVKYVTSEKLHHSLDEVSLNKTVGAEGSGAAGDAEKQKPDEAGHSEEQGNGIQQVERSDVDIIENDSKQAKVTDKYEEPADLKAEDIQESDTDISMESSSNLEDGKEEYKEGMDEPEF